MKKLITILLLLISADAGAGIISRNVGAPIIVGFGALTKIA